MRPSEIEGYCGVAVVPLPIISCWRLAGRNGLPLKIVKARAARKAPLVFLFVNDDLP